MVTRRQWAAEFPRPAVGDLVGNDTDAARVRSSRLGDRALHRGPRPDGFGEGTTYRITLTEGDGVYNRWRRPVCRHRWDDKRDVRAGLINGIAQGQDTTNRFMFTFRRRHHRRDATDGDGDSRRRDIGVQPATCPCQHHAVRLMSFEAVPGTVVTLEWRNGSELDNLGFHLYRGLSAAGPWTRLTSSFIHGSASSRWGRRTPGSTRPRQRVCATTTVSRTWTPLRCRRSTARVSRCRRHPPRACDGVVVVVSRARCGAGRRGGDDVSGGCWRRRPASSRPCAPGTESQSPVSLDILRDATSVTVELQTGGFWALHEASGTVRVFVPGLELPSDPRARRCRCAARSWMPSSEAG